LKAMFSYLPNSYLRVGFPTFRGITSYLTGRK